MTNKKMRNYIAAWMYSELEFLLFFVFIIALYIIFVNIEPQKLAASITFALLIVTWSYVRNTAQIIRESGIDRELRIIYGKLSELYSLLKFHPTILQISPEDFNGLKKRSYLASENMQKLRLSGVD